MWLNFRSVAIPYRCVLIHCLTLCVQLIGLDVDGKFSQTIVIIQFFMLTSPLGFHSNKCWLSGIVDCLLKGGSPQSYWCICALGWRQVLLGMVPLEHVALGLLATLMFCYVWGDCACNNCHTRFSTPPLCRLVPYSPLYDPSSWYTYAHFVMTSSSSREHYLAKGEGIEGSSTLLGLVGA